MRGLPEAVAAACFTFIDQTLAVDSYRVGKPLRHDMEGLHSARRGVYRIVYRIDETAHVIEIVTIAHRADVYRPL